MTAFRGARERGSALIAVLWLVAALAAITLALATTVRSETERASTASEGVRAYYLAAGSINRALLWILWGGQYRRPDGSPMFFEAPMPRLNFHYPGGEAIVEVIPESSKFNINTITPLNLMKLLMNLDEPEGQARELTAAIVDWRSGASGPTLFDSYYLQQPSSFHAPHASFRELEELLLVQGMTTDLFYGHYVRDPGGRFVWITGLRDCLTTVGSDLGFDINTVEPAVLATLGVAPDAIAQIVARRNLAPILKLDELRALLPGEAAAHLTAGGGNSSIVTLRATAWMTLDGGQAAETRKTVAALVKLEGPGWPRPFTVLRWYDDAHSDLLPRPVLAAPPAAGENGS